MERALAIYRTEDAMVEWLESIQSVKVGNDGAEEVFSVPEVDGMIRHLDRTEAHHRFRMALRMVSTVRPRAEEEEDGMDACVDTIARRVIEKVLAILLEETPLVLSVASQAKTKKGE
jgi:hypothetical protein